MNWKKLEKSLKSNKGFVEWYSFFIGIPMTLLIVLIPVFLFFSGLATIIPHLLTSKIVWGTILMTLGLSIPYYIYISNQVFEQTCKDWKVKKR